MDEAIAMRATDPGPRLRQQALVLGLIAVAIVVAMCAVFVRFLGGWEHIQHVGGGAAFFERFAQALALTGAKKTMAAAASWRCMYVMFGLLFALMVVGKLLEGTLGKLQRYRRFREQQEWGNRRA